MLRRDWSVKLNDIYREGNQEADGLSKLGSSLPIGMHEFDIPLSHVRDCLLFDAIGTNIVGSLIGRVYVPCFGLSWFLFALFIFLLVLSEFLL